jgi:hypothetical protein
LEYEAKFMVIELQPDIVTQSKHVSSPEFDDVWMKNRLKEEFLMPLCRRRSR